MKNKTLSFVLLILFAIFTARIIQPPFANPAEYAHDTYQDLLSKLGEPSSRMEGKHFSWSAVLPFGGWELRAGFSTPPTLKTTPTSIERVCWIALPNGATLNLISQKIEIANGINSTSSLSTH